MRPRVDDRAVRLLRAGVPQFEPCYLDLCEIYGEDLTPAVVFSELADFVANLLDEDAEPELVERCMATVEEVATAPDLDVVEVVGYAFLDGLRPDSLELARSYLGPVTERILAALAAGELDFGTNASPEPSPADGSGPADELSAFG